MILLKSIALLLFPLTLMMHTAHCGGQNQHSDTPTPFPKYNPYPGYTPVPETAVNELLAKPTPQVMFRGEAVASEIKAKGIVAKFRGSTVAAMAEYEGQTFSLLGVVEKVD